MPATGSSKPANHEGPADQGPVQSTPTKVSTVNNILSHGATVPDRVVAAGIVIGVALAGGLLLALVQKHTGSPVTGY